MEVIKRILCRIMQNELCYKNNNHKIYENLKFKIQNISEDTAYILVPLCVYRGGYSDKCENCEMYKDFLPQYYTDVINLDTRYQIYNDWFKNNY